MAQPSGALEHAAAQPSPSFDVVIPTIGRPSLARLLDALAEQTGPAPHSAIVVDDRRQAGALPWIGERSTMAQSAALAERVRVVRTAGRGPAAARNAGWRAGEAAWVVFLDDDVLPPRDWSETLVRDLLALPLSVGASQGRVRVLPPSRRGPSGARRPTDWERNVAGLQQARWASADIAYRREVLRRTGGFDERFARAYREDSDLALRAQALGFELVRGARLVEHPVGPAPFWHSVRLQRGNADDALMRRLHGRRWRERAQAPAGRLSRHVLVSASGLGSVCLALLGRRRAAVLAGATSLAGVAELAWRRIAPGPRTADELARMLATSSAIPFAATFHRLRGEIRWRAAHVEPAAMLPQAAAPCSAADRAGSTADFMPMARGWPPEAVLFDRDGTLIEDVPYNGDPARVTLRPGAREALRALRAAGVQVAVISNQSGLARGLIDERQVQAVNRRTEELLGRIDAWLLCPHAPEDGCDCRKPAPGLVLRAASSLGVRPERCAVVGDIGADVQAAIAAGARGVLVPNGRTLPEEVSSAPELAPDLRTAVSLLLGAEGYAARGEASQGDARQADAP